MHTPNDRTPSDPAPTAPPLRIAVLGGGYGAKVALPTYAASPAFEPVAVWSRRPERARAVAAAAALELGSADLDEVLSHPRLEAVHVATPVALHEPFAIAAARQGLHVLCEKPLATDLAGGRRIAAAVEDAGVVGMVNLARRFEQTRRRLVERAHHLVGLPRLIRISLVHSDHADPASRPWTWVHDTDAGGGRLQAYGVHDLDLLLQLLDGPAGSGVETVAATTDIAVPCRDDADGRRHTVTAEDGYAILVRLEGGGLAVVDLISTAHHGRSDIVEIYGADGTVRLDVDGRIWSATTGESLTVEGPFDDAPTAAFAVVAGAFASAVRFGTAPRPALVEGLRVQAILDAARQADRSQSWVQPESVAGI